MISDRALSTPNNTAELIVLKNFIKMILEVTLKNLEDKLREIIEHILILSNYHCITDYEIYTNNITFQWYHKIPHILEENESIVGYKTLEFQQALRGALDSKWYEKKNEGGSKIKDKLFFFVLIQLGILSSRRSWNLARNKWTRSKIGETSLRFTNIRRGRKFWKIVWSLPWTRSISLTKRKLRSAGR